MSDEPGSNNKGTTTASPGEDQTEGSSSTATFSQAAAAAGASKRSMPPTSAFVNNELASTGLSSSPLTPSRFDAPLSVKQPSAIQNVTEFQRFEKMARSWLWRRGIAMFVGTSLLYNALFCPVMQLHPAEDKNLVGLRRRRYGSEWFNVPNFGQQAFGWKRRVWLFGYNHQLDHEVTDADYLKTKEAERAQRAQAAREALKYNNEKVPRNVSFGSAPLRPEDLPANVKWNSAGLSDVLLQQKALKKSSSSSSSGAQQQGQDDEEEEDDFTLLAAQQEKNRRPPISTVFKSMWVSVLKWLPRTLTFNRPWGDPSGNSIQYNTLLFEPVSYSAVKHVMVPVRPVELTAEDGSMYEVKMLCQLYYRKEQNAKFAVGHLAYGESEAMVDYIAPQVCDGWLGSFSNFDELIESVPLPFRTTGTESVLRNLPELASYLLNMDEEPPQVIQPLTLETPKTLEQSISTGAKMMQPEEILRRHLAAKILNRMAGKIAIDDIFWHLTVKPIEEGHKDLVTQREQVMAEHASNVNSHQMLVKEANKKYPKEAGLFSAMTVPTYSATTNVAAAQAQK